MKPTRSSEKKLSLEHIITINHRITYVKNNLICMTVCVGVCVWYLLYQFNDLIL